MVLSLSPLVPLVSRDGPRLSSSIFCFCLLRTSSARAAVSLALVPSLLSTLRLATRASNERIDQLTRRVKSRPAIFPRRTIA